MILRNRVLFGVGAIDGLPEVVAEAGGARTFVVTDPGVRRAGIVDPVVDALAAAGLATAVFDEVEPNPAAATVERGAQRLRDLGLAGTVVVAIGGGSAMDAAKAIDLAAANDRPVWDLEYDGADLAPGLPIVAVPTTAGTGSEAHSFAVITRRGDRAQGLHRPSLAAAGHDDPRPGPDRRPAAGGHRRDRDRRDDPLARVAPVGQPEPVRRGDGARGRPDGRNVAPRAVADGSNLEARSQLLLASHLAGVGQASGTGVGLVHALGHAIGTRGKVAHGTALAAVLPEVLTFYLGTRDRELALVGIALGVASAAEPDATAAAVAIGAIDKLLRDVDQRPTLRRLGPRRRRARH